MKMNILTKHGRAAHLLSRATYYMDFDILWIVGEPLNKCLRCCPEKRGQEMMLPPLLAIVGGYNGYLYH